MSQASLGVRVEVLSPFAATSQRPVRLVATQNLLRSLRTFFLPRHDRVRFCWSLETDVLKNRHGKDGLGFTKFWPWNLRQSPAKPLRALISDSNSFLGAIALGWKFVCELMVVNRRLNSTELFFRSSTIKHSHGHHGREYYVVRQVCGFDEMSKLTGVLCYSNDWSNTGLQWRIQSRPQGGANLCSFCSPSSDP